MGKINRIPLGLLDLLSSKTDGRTPQEMSDIVAGVIDLEKYYLSERLSHEFFTFSAAAITSNGSIQIPGGESWAIRSIQIQYQALLAADDLAIHMTAERLPDAASALSRMGIFDAELPATTVNQFVTRTRWYEEPMHFPSGVIIRATADRVAAAARTVSVNFGLSRFEI